MKKSNYFIPITIMIVIIFMSSCKKDNTNGKPYNPFAKIQTITTNYNGFPESIETFQYDYLGRVVKDMMNDSSYITYEYSNSMITEKQFSNNNTLTALIALSLNSNGYVTSGTINLYGNKKKSGTNRIKLGTNLISTCSGSFNATYDNNGYLIYVGWIEEDSTKTIFYKGTSKYTIFNENTISLTTSDIYTTDSLIQTEQYTFKDTSNTIGLENQGIFFLGKQNKNLTSTYTFITNDVTNNYTSTNNYTDTYEYDSKGRVTKQTETDNSNNTTISIYTYSN